MRATLRLLIFVVAGPPIGLLVYLCGNAAIDVALHGMGRFGELRAVAEMMFSPFALEMGYFVGGIPALLTGVTATVLAGRMPNGWPYRGWVVLSGAVISAIVTLVMMWNSLTNSSFGGPLPVLGFLASMAATGAVAALASALLFDVASRHIWRTA